MTGPSGERPPRRGGLEEGVSAIEYALLVALVAMVAAGALLGLGRGVAAPAHVVQTVDVQVSGVPAAPGPAQGPSGETWCSSGKTGCTDTVNVGQAQEIDFSASGGTSPYTYVLGNAPSFVTIQQTPPGAGQAALSISPKDCSAVGSYAGITVTVTDTSTPPQRGRLTFSLTVPATGC